MAIPPFWAEVVWVTQGISGQFSARKAPIKLAVLGCLCCVAQVTWNANPGRFQFLKWSILGDSFSIGHMWHMGVSENCIFHKLPWLPWPFNLEIDFQNRLWRPGFRQTRAFLWCPLNEKTWGWRISFDTANQIWRRLSSIFNWVTIFVVITKREKLANLSYPACHARAKSLWRPVASLFVSSVCSWAVPKQSSAAEMESQDPAANMQCYETSNI